MPTMFCLSRMAVPFRSTFQRAFSSSSDEKRKTLVLLDFNGTLVFRDRRRAFVRSAEFDLGFKNVYFVRPGARELAAALLDDDRCMVAVYTSILRVNMEPLISHIFGGGNVLPRGELEAGRVAIFDQPYNIRNPKFSRHREHLPRYLRDLPSIWNDSAVAKHDFGVEDTVMVEAKVVNTKLRDNAEDNTIFVPEYSLDFYTGKEREMPENELPLTITRQYLLDTVFPQMQNPDASVRNILKESRPQMVDSGTQEFEDDDGKLQF